MTETNQVLFGDCRKIMEGIEDNSIDTIITDSPYGLSKEPDIAEVLTHWLNGDDYEQTGGGFMGKSWDSFVPGPSVWRECFRVMKPGGCLLAFGGTRTVDLLSIAIRMAGFQKFDEIVWLHAQGFPKSTDISKKLDEMAGAEREVIARVHPADKYDGSNRKDGHRFTGNTLNNGDYGQSRLATITAPATDDAKTWGGYGTALKPAHEVILCFWKPREKSYADNALKWGVAGLNIDGARIATGEGIETGRNGRKAKASFQASELNNLLPQYQSSGRYPANVILTHHPDCVRVGEKRVRGSHLDHICSSDSQQLKNLGTIHKTGHTDPDGLETVEDWRCVESCPVRALDEMAGVRKSGGKTNGRQYEHNYCDKTDGGWQRGDAPHYCYGDSGSASRFFYTAKASGREKWFCCQICGDAYPYADREDHAHGKPKGKRKHQIAHPTVKPLALLEYLCKLTKTPTGGIVLDPFAGSGTTGEACLKTGREFILIENDETYYRIAQKRLNEAAKEARQLSLI